MAEPRIETDGPPLAAVVPAELGSDRTKLRCKGYGPTEGTCVRDATAERGVYGRLCDECKAAKQAGGKVRIGGTAAPRGALADAVKALTPHARKLEQKVAVYKHRKEGVAESRTAASDALDEFAEALAVVKAAAEALVA